MGLYEENNNIKSEYKKKRATKRKDTGYKIVLAFVAIFLVIMVSALTIKFINVGASNKTLFDTTYNFNYAIIQLPNGEIVEGEVKEWDDYEDSDQLQVVLKETGDTYLVHSEDCVLIKR